MSKFSKLMENTFRNTTLRRVKLKVDPAFCEKGEISKFQGYEGFILAEKGNKVKMYIENFEGGIIATIPSSMIDVESGLSKLEKLKLNVLLFLKEEKNMKFDDNLVQMIMNSSDIHMLESYLLDNGCTERDLLEIYRADYI
jgi:ribosomal protein L21E